MKRVDQDDGELRRGLIYKHIQLNEIYVETAGSMIDASG